jgi:fatty acid desaturase
VGGQFPGGHFYLKNLTYGDGFTQFGLALGCSVALWALIAAAFAYASDRIYLYVILALWVAMLVSLSMIGIVGMH